MPLGLARPLRAEASHAIDNPVIIAAAVLASLNGFVTIRFRTIWSLAQPTGEVPSKWQWGLSGYRSLLKAFPVMLVAAWALVVAAVTSQSLESRKIHMSAEVVIAIGSIALLVVCMLIAVAILYVGRPRLLIPPAFRRSTR